MRGIVWPHIDRREYWILNRREGGKLYWKPKQRGSNRQRQHAAARARGEKWDERKTRELRWQKLSDSVCAWTKQTTLRTALQHHSLRPAINTTSSSLATSCNKICHNTMSYIFCFRFSVSIKASFVWIDINWSEMKWIELRESELNWTEINRFEWLN